MPAAEYDIAQVFSDIVHKHDSMKRYLHMATMRLKRAAQRRTEPMRKAAHRRALTHLLDVADDLSIYAERDYGLKIKPERFRPLVLRAAQHNL